jgi:hypothetical protein
MMQLYERVPLNQFMPFVMAGCMACPESIAIAAIRQACITFCQRSGWLRRTVKIDQQSKVTAYPIWSDQDEQIVRINRVCVNDQCYSGQRNRCDFKYGAYRFTISDGLLIVAPVPQQDKENAIEVHFCATPTHSTCEVDATLYHDWSNAIEDGTLAKLYALPNYAFSDVRLAQIKNQQFNEHINRARIRALKNEIGDVVMARAPSFI